MKWERLLLIAFLGSYLINNVVAGVVSLIPPSATPGFWTPQYLSFIALSAIAVALFAWWYFASERASSLWGGITFGIVGFLVAIATALVSGISGVLQQSGSLAQVATVLPNFGPFLLSWSTLSLACYWIIPSALVGWLLAMRTNDSSMTM
jgi:hypothetical protein